MDIGDPNRLRFQFRDIELRSPASQTLVLPGAGEKIQTWLPDDKSAYAVEVRARIVATSAPDTEIPIVRFFVELGHGDSVWRDPTPFQRTAGVDVDGFSLPGRGVGFLVNARQLRLGFRNDGAVSGANVESTTVQVSMLPTNSTSEHRSVYAPSVWGPLNTVQAFPLTAREWRVMTNDGLPVTGGPPMVDLLAVSGAVIATMQQQDYDDWQPIPHEAAAYRFTNTAAYGAFR